MLIELYSAVVKGNRKSNDDRLLVDDIILDDGDTLVTKLDSGILSALDGVGGCPRGGDAAEIVARELASLKGVPPDVNLLKRVVISAENKIIAEMFSSRDSFGMSTTMTGIWFYDNAGLVFNIGDSCVFRFRNSLLSKLVRENNLANFNKEMGLPVMPNDDNVLTKSVGSGCSDPDITKISVLPSDIMLICTDGLSKYVSEDEIEQVLGSLTDVQTAGERLMTIALENGSKDNISIILARSV